MKEADAVRAIAAKLGAQGILAPANGTAAEDIGFVAHSFAPDLKHKGKLRGLLLSAPKRCTNLNSTSWQWVRVVSRHFTSTRVMQALLADAS